MTREEFNEILDIILPPVVGGMVRPTDPIPTDLDFCTEFRQLLQADMNLANHENAFLRQLFSNDKQCQTWINELMEALAKQDFNLATQKIKGLMSAADKTKLDGVATGAEVNQNAISNIKAGTQTVAATTKTDTLEIVAGANIALSVSGKKLTVGVDGIASGAEVNQNAFATVQVGTAKINATAKTDTLQIAAGKNVSILTDSAAKKITIQLDGELGLNLLKRNTAYEVGDIAYSPNLPSWARIECVAAGTTDAVDISLPQNTNGGGGANN